MVKKGKFKLLTYFLDDFLIFYNSLNKSEKIIAFAILKIKRFNSILPILNNFILKRKLSYYSIQVDLTEKEKYKIILNFEDRSKEIIKKIFNNIYQTLLNEDIQMEAMKKKNLSREFFKFIIQEIDNNNFVAKVSDSLILQHYDNYKALTFYWLNLNIVKNTQSFLFSFLNILLNFNHKGYLIFNIDADLSENLTISSYFVEVRNFPRKDVHIEDEVNNFFNCDLISKLNVQEKYLSRVFWRLRLLNKFYPFEEIKHIFTTQCEYTFQNLSELNLQIEYNLRKHNIRFKRISKTIILIDQRILFLVMRKIKIDLIKSVLNKFYSKYWLYILIIDWNEYKKIIESKELKELKNVKVLNTDDFLNLDLKIFK